MRGLPQRSSDSDGSSSQVRPRASTSQHLGLRFKSERQDQTEHPLSSVQGISNLENSVWCLRNLPPRLLAFSCHFSAASKSPTSAEGAAKAPMGEATFHHDSSQARVADSMA